MNSKSGLIETFTADHFKHLDFLIDENHEPSEVLERLKVLCPNKVLSFINRKETSNEKYFLTYKNDNLCVLFKNQNPISVDFLNSNLKKMFGQISKKDTFCKALGLKEAVSVVFDLTAGFGYDTFVISKFVEKIFWVERNPLICLLLEDGLRRLANQFPEQRFKFEIVYSEAFDYIKKINTQHSKTIFFDFMFENKKTKSNKEMSFLKHITLNDPANNIDDLISQSLHILTGTSKSRVVLKAKNFSDAKLKPKHIFKGKTVHYFVF